jgi:hypothetical protein
MTKPIQKLTDATGEALLIHDAHNKPFLMMPARKYITDIQQHQQLGFITGIASTIAAFILFNLINFIGWRLCLQILFAGLALAALVQSSKWRKR